MLETKASLGFAQADQQLVRSLAERFGDIITPDDVQTTLRMLSSQTKTVIFLDVFDSIRDYELQRHIADCIKPLSDHVVPSTIG